MKKASFKRGWIIFVFCGLLWALTAFYGACASIYLPLVSQVYEIAPSGLLYAITIGCVISAIATFFSGKLFLKFRAKTLIAFGLILQGVSFGLIPNVRFSFLCYVMVVVLQISFIFYCGLGSLVLIGNWFPRTKGKIMGWVTSFVALTTIVMVPLFQKLVSAVGVKLAMPIMGLISVIFGFIAVFLVKDYPQDCGLLPDNRPLDESELVKNTRKSNWSMLTVIKNRNFWLQGLAWGCVLLPIAGLQSFAMSAFVEAGFSSIAVTLVSLSMIANFIGSTVSGYIDSGKSSRVSSIFIMLVMVAGFVVCAIGAAGVPVLFVIGYYVIQFASGAPNNLVASTTMDISGPENFAPSYAFVLCIASLIKAAGSTVAGVVFSFSGTYSGSFWVYVVICVLSLVLLLVTKHQRWNPNIESVKSEQTSK